MKEAIIVRLEQLMKDASEIAYGDVLSWDFDEAVEVCLRGAVERAVDSILNEYSDQDGGEVDMDDLYNEAVEDLNSMVA